MSYDCGDSVFAVGGGGLSEMDCHRGLLSAAGDALLAAGDVQLSGAGCGDALAVECIAWLELCGRRLEEGYPCRCLLLKYDEEEVGDIALGQEILL